MIVLDIVEYKILSIVVFMLVFVVVDVNIVLIFIIVLKFIKLCNLII